MSSNVPKIEHSEFGWLLVVLGSLAIKGLGSAKEEVGRARSSEANLAERLREVHHKIQVRVNRPLSLNRGQGYLVRKSKSVKIQIFGRFLAFPRNPNKTAQNLIFSDLVLRTKF